MKYDEAIETLDEIIGPSLWQFRDDGRNPAAGHVYEVLGMGELNEEAVVIRGRAPIAWSADPWRRAFFSEQWQTEDGFPRLWTVEPIDEFLARFEEVDRTLVPRGESVLGERGRVFSML